MSEHFNLTAAVYVVMVRDGKVLLIRRANTGYQDGKYALPAGHLIEGESVREGAAREAMEEVAVIVEQEDLTVVHTMIRQPMQPNDNPRPYIDFYLEAKSWSGEPKNNEPHVCDDVAWFPLDQLPQNTSPAICQAIECIQRGQTFSEFGW